MRDESMMELGAELDEKFAGLVFLPAEDIE